MSKKYALVKKFYDEGRWPSQWVADAVMKKWITAEEYQEITGETYVVNNG